MSAPSFPSHALRACHLIGVKAANSMGAIMVITADDGHASVYTEMFARIRARRFHVTLFVHPSAISNAPYAMTWAQLRELEDSGLFDIQSHTYWHPNFRDEKKRLAPSAYDTLVTTQLLRSRQLLKTRLDRPD